MTESHLMGCTAGVMQFAVAGYALRLNRRYGTARVGWSLFGAFSLLALLQLIQSTAPFSAGSGLGLEINTGYVLVSFLLLIGMLHLESMLKERLRMERIELQLRADLETEIKSKTEHLTRAIEDLMSEMVETKRMAAIIESADRPGLSKTADGFAETVHKPAPAHPPVRRYGGDTQFLASILCGEWIAHF